MYFNSYYFVLYFMPALLVGYYILGKWKPAAAHLWLLAFSLLFCFTHGWAGTLILVADGLVNYFLSGFLGDREEGKKKRNKALLILGILVNTGALLGLKYVGFFASLVSAITKHEITASAVLIPLGISYLTFRQIGYLVDIYKGEMERPSFLDYGNYCLYFPMMVQGPITTAQFFLPKLKEEGHTKFNPDRFAKGMFWFATGLFKKTFLSDTLAKPVAWCFDNIPYLTSTDILILIFSYSFELYFDFSGYCDMANGVSEMLGITLPVNFDSPYKSASITEMWRRWHITLTEFMRKYVYFPMGGSRKGKIRTYINILVVFLLSGFWHGASMTYVVWGLLNGLAQCMERLFKKQLGRIHIGVRRVVTYIYWCITLLVFSASTLKDSWTIFSGFFTRHDFSVHWDLVKSATLFELDYLEPHLGTLGEWLPYLHLPFFLIFSAVWVWGTKNLYEKEFKTNFGKLVFTALVLFWGIISMGGITTFLYAIY